MEGVSGQVFCNSALCAKNEKRKKEKNEFTDSLSEPFFHTFTI